MISTSSKTLAMAIVAATLTFSATAEEQTGTIKFKGFIYNATCTINLNDANSPDAEVKMGRFATSEFNKKGDEVGGTSGDGKLDIKLIDCPDQGTVSLKLSGKASSADSTILELDNADSDATAKNVGIRMYYIDNQSSPIPVNGSTSQTIDVTGNSSQWEGTYIAKYISTKDDVEAGQADATLNYKITYN